MSFKPVTHVIFDLDGTLLDTEPAYVNIIGGIAKSYGKEYTHEVQLKVLGSKEQDTCRIFLKELGLEGQVTEDDFFKEYHSRSQQYLQGVELMPGAKKLLEHLHQYKIPFALATSSNKDSVKIKTAHLKDLFDKFHHMVMATSDPEVKNGKPAPDIFLVCASRFDPPADPEKCLVFEDAPSGATGSVKAKMQVVAIPDPSVPKELFPKETTLFLKSLEDFNPTDFGLPSYEYCKCKE